MEGLGRAGWDRLLAPLCCRIFRRENFIKGGIEWHIAIDQIVCVIHVKREREMIILQITQQKSGPGILKFLYVQQKEHDVLHPVLVRQAGHLRVNSQLCQVEHCEAWPTQPPLVMFPGSRVPLRGGNK